MPQNRFHRECVICNVKVKKYAQHLRNQHGVPKDEALQISRDTKTFTDKPEVPELSKSGRRRWICGLTGCGKNVVNRRHHMEYKHELEKGTEIYAAVLARFTPYVPGQQHTSDSESLPDIDTDNASTHLEIDQTTEDEDTVQEPTDITLTNTEDDPDDASTHLEMAQRTKENEGTVQEPMEITHTNTEDDPDDVSTHPEMAVITKENEETMQEPMKMPHTHTEDDPDDASIHSEMAHGSQEDEETVEKPVEKTPTEEDPDNAVPPTPPGGSPGHWDVMILTLEEYLKDLTSIKGGCKPLKVARQHVNQVKMFWEFSGNITAAEAFHEDKLNSWVESLLGNLQPGTIKSYLCSVSQFLKFAFVKDLLQNKMNTFIECTTFIKNSMRYLAKRQSQRQVEVNEEATENLLDPEARAYILNGNYLDNLSKQFRSDKSKYYPAYRDALMLYVTVSNGTRVSALLNLTIPQVHKAAPSVIDNVDYYTISVVQHKTSMSRGAAKISLRKREYADLLALSKYVLKHHPGDDRLFRNELGAPFGSGSHVNIRIQTAWRLSGAYSKYGRLTSKINRQTITCQGRERDPSKAKEIADQLKHKLTTADKFYHVYSSAGASARTVHWLNEHGTGVRTDDNNSDSEDEHYKTHDIPGIKDTITSEEIRAGIVQVLQQPKGVGDMMEEAEQWKGKTREFSVKTSFLSIHRALRRKLESFGIDVDQEILSMLAIDTLNTDMQLKTTFLSVFAVELARHYGCKDDVFANPFRSAVASTPLPSPPKTKGKGQGKKTLVTVDDAPRVRRRIAPEVEIRIKDVYQTLIENARLGREPVLLKSVREKIHLFPDFTAQQIRDKIKNIVKYK